MPKVQYGNKTIDYTILEKEGLSSYYITVEKHEGVTLKGESVSLEKSQQLILKKARWILDKLNLVEAMEEGDIVTGSRVQYLGRRYYVEVVLTEAISEIVIEFTESKFKVLVPYLLHQQRLMEEAFQ